MSSFFLWSFDPSALVSVPSDRLALGASSAHHTWPHAERRRPGHVLVFRLVTCAHFLCILSLRLLVPFLSSVASIPLPLGLIASLGFASFSLSLTLRLRAPHLLLFSFLSIRVFPISSCFSLVLGFMSLFLVMRSDFAYLRFLLCHFCLRSYGALRLVPFNFSLLCAALHICIFLCISSSISLLPPPPHLSRTHRFFLVSRLHFR